MELFTRLFGHRPAFAHHCFERVVIHGELTGFFPPEHAVHFFREVRAGDDQGDFKPSAPIGTRAGAEAFARNHRIPIAWAEKAVRKEDYVPALGTPRRATKCDGVYPIFKNMEVAVSRRRASVMLNRGKGQRPFGVAV